MEIHSIQLDNNYSFNDLSNTTFENISNGRKAVNLIKTNDDNTIPIMRTTSKYFNKPVKFNDIHFNIIKDINDKLCKYIDFNTALMEIYSPSYKSMKFHTDCGLDLVDDSFICIYSNYSNSSYNRTLLIKNKLNNDTYNIDLKHNCFVLFSKNFNKNNLHKIVYNNKSSDDWLGITFRISKSFIKFIDNKPYINGDELIYNSENASEFYKLKTLENKSVDFDYPYINYSINPSDFLTI